MRRVEKQVFGVKMECSDEVGLKCPLYIHAGSRKCGREFSKAGAGRADLEAIVEKMPWESVGETKEKPTTGAGDTPRAQRLGVRQDGQQEDRELGEQSEKCGEVGEGGRRLAERN